MIKYLEFRKFLNIMDEAELNPQEKEKLKSLGREWEVINKALTKIKNKVTNKMLTENLSTEFVKWAIYMIWYLKWMMK